MGDIEQNLVGSQINMDFSVRSSIKHTRKCLGECFNCREEPNYKEILNGSSCNATKECVNGSSYLPIHGEGKNKDKDN